MDHDVPSQDSINVDTFVVPAATHEISERQSIEESELPTGAVDITCCQVFPFQTSNNAVELPDVVTTELPVAAHHEVDGHETLRALTSRPSEDDELGRLIKAEEVMPFQLSAIGVYAAPL